MVSVCMASFNGERFIHEQISSILAQLNMEDELVISDDSSTDDTVHIIKGIQDKRIKLLEGNTFRDPIQNFQNALRNAKGDIIFLSDQDDVWMENKCRKMLECLEEYDLVVSDSVVVDEKLNEIAPSFFRYLKSGKGIMKNIIKSTYYGSCMAFRRDLLERSLPFPATREIGHDLWIGLVAEMTGKVLFLHEPLLLYRRHSSSFTGTGKSSRNISQMLKGRIIMLREIVKFYLKHICYGKRFSVGHYPDV